MNNLNLAQFEVSPLTDTDMQKIVGGNMYVFFDDAQGYHWTYTYSDSGRLVGVSVARLQCVQ